MINLISSINTILKNNYPIKKSFDEINNLSHFEIFSNNYNKFLTININIDGLILSGPYKNYQIDKVFTTEIIDWNKYILLYVSFLDKSRNPCINKTNFIYLIHTYNYNNVLNIKKMLIKHNNHTIEYEVDYIDTHKYYLPSLKTIYNNNINKKDNHFYLDDFSVNDNYKKLKIDIDRLIKNRDKYRNIHFYLNNNGGGDIVPAHMIVRCLIGQRENWMKPIQKIETTKEILEWNCWEEENKDSPNYKVVKKLNLDTLPNYDTKYNGKIYVHMNKQNGSSAWFFITYLIYGFSTKMNRFSKKCYGQDIKYGAVESDQLVLLGHSGTTSGDGNQVLIKKNNIEILCPTEQFISCSVKKYDWNRFWIGQ